MHLFIKTQIARTLRHSKEKRIRLSLKDIKDHLRRQKQLTVDLKSKFQSKSEILEKIQFIDQSIDDSPGPEPIGNTNTISNPSDSIQLDTPSELSDDHNPNIIQITRPRRKRTHHEMETDHNEVSAVDNDNDKFIKEHHTDSHHTENSTTHNNQWQCSRCTLLNTLDSMRCSVCNTIKPRNVTLTPSPSKKPKLSIDSNISNESKLSNPRSRKSDIIDLTSSPQFQSHSPSHSPSPCPSSPCSISSIPTITVRYRPYTHSRDDADDDIFEERLRSFHLLKDAFTQIRAKNQVKNRTDNLSSELQSDSVHYEVDSDIPSTFYDDDSGFIDIHTKTKYSSNPLLDSRDTANSIMSISNSHSHCLLPLWLYRSLYRFQRDALKWFWKNYNQSVGGILGDDMGLGKTIQTISFLESLRVSQCGGPALVICPASVLQQWMRECHKWAPQLRTMLLHDTGRHQASHREVIQKLLDSCFTTKSDGNQHGDYRECCGGVVITTYESMKVHDALLLPIKWGIVVLDEGHRIRNPNAAITLTAKQLKCRHRYILTGL